MHDGAPARPPADATGGHAPRGFDVGRACIDWDHAVGPEGSAARSHASFPEIDRATSCFAAVRYGPDGPHPDPSPPGCGYPAADPLAETLARLEERASRYEAIAAGAPSSGSTSVSVPLPLELACALPDDVRRAAALVNGRTTRALAGRLAGRVKQAQAPYPYAAVATFGFGFGGQSRSALVSFRPGGECPKREIVEPDLFDSNSVRAGRAAEAYFAGVAPVVVVSGGAIHSRLTEAFLLDYLLTCHLGVPESVVLLDPCADHTHTNIRNTGSLVAAIGGRTAYLVTDDGLQSGYLEEWTLFNLIGGSIDQRSRRDFGYLLGSFRLASVGMKAGFWYTPYRFWAEPKKGLGSFTCIP